MSTRMRVLRWIQEHYDGSKLAGRTCWMIAEECQVAISTVYRAIKALRIMGAVNDDKVYTGRQFVKPTEIARYADPDRMILLTEAKQQQIARDLFATKSALYAGIRWGLQRSDFEELNGLRNARVIRVPRQAVAS